MWLDAERVRRNAQQAPTEDLLDRVTVYRAGMEPEALPILEAELASRGVTAKDIAAHAEERSWETIPLPDGTVARCSLCYRPAVVRNWGWYWMWGFVPVFAQYRYYCTEHHSGPRRSASRAAPEERKAEEAPRGNGAAPPESGEQGIHIRLGD